MLLFYARSFVALFALCALTFSFCSNGILNLCIVLSLSFDCCTFVARILMLLTIVHFYFSGFRLYLGEIVWSHSFYIALICTIASSIGTLWAINNSMEYFRLDFFAFFLFAHSKDTIPIIFWKRTVLDLIRNVFESMIDSPKLRKKDLRRLNRSKWNVIQLFREHG